MMNTTATRWLASTAQEAWIKKQTIPSSTPFSKDCQNASKMIFGYATKG